MAANSRPYFNQTRLGESRWWSWLVGFWFILLGWLAAQFIITLPIPFIAIVHDPELFNQFLESANASSAENGAAMQTYGTLFLISTLLGIMFWIIHRTTEGQTRKTTGWLTGISIGLSFLSLVLLAPMSSDPETSAFLTQIMGMSPSAFALFLLTFPGTLIGVYLVQKLIHKRTITSLHTAASKIRWGRIVQTFFIMWGVMAVMTAILHFTGLSPVRSLEINMTRFLTFALVSLLLIPLQSATEEIVFRGYLNQGLGHFVSNKWVVFVITSLLFMSMHLANPEALEGAEKGILPLVMSGYFMFGFVACIIVYFEDGLEAAIGLHAANNTFAAVFVNYEGSVLPTPSVFLAGVNPHVDIPVGILTLGLVAFLYYKTRKPLA